MLKYEMDAVTDLFKLSHKLTPQLFAYKISTKNSNITTSLYPKIKKKDQNVPFYLFILWNIYVKHSVVYVFPVVRILFFTYSPSSK